MTGKTIEIICDYCGKSFLKEVKYINLNLKRGTITNFCGVSCKCKYFASIEHKEKYLNYGRDRDKYSPFRKYHTSIRKRSKELNYSLEEIVSLEELSDLWDRQDKKCALSGIEMIISSNTGDSLQRQPFMASIDRIDSNKWYLPNNVQWVCLIGQYAKNSFSIFDLARFCTSFCQHQSLSSESLISMVENQTANLMISGSEPPDDSYASIG